MRRRICIGIVMITIVSLLLYLKGYGVFINRFYLPQIGNYTQLVTGGGGGDYLSSIGKFIQKRQVSWIIKPRNIYLEIEKKGDIISGSITNQNHVTPLNVESIDMLLDIMETAKQTWKSGFNTVKNSSDIIEIQFEYSDRSTITYYIHLERNKSYIEQSYKGNYTIHSSFVHLLSSLMEF